MSFFPIFDPMRSGRRRWRVPVRSAVAFGALWWTLAGNSVESWSIGVPAVLVGAWLTRPWQRRFSVSLPGLSRFVPWFLYESVAGAVDVALRALRPAMPLHPGLVEYRVRLADGAPRVVLAQVIGMLPGTLSADLDGRRLVIHALDTGTDIEALVVDLEARIAALFGIALETGSSRGQER